MEKLYFCCLNDYAIWIEKQQIDFEHYQSFELYAMAVAEWSADDLHRHHVFHCAHLRHSGAHRQKAKREKQAADGDVGALRHEPFHRTCWTCRFHASKGAWTANRSGTRHVAFRAKEILFQPLYAAGALRQDHGANLLIQFRNTQHPRQCAFCGDDFHILSRPGRLRNYDNRFVQERISAEVPLLGSANSTGVPV